MSGISKESAREELKRFYEYYELDREELNQKQIEAIEPIEEHIIKGLQKGMIEFTDDNGFTIVQKLKSGETVNYKEMNGHAKMAMSKKSETDYTGQNYALLGSLSGLGQAGIVALRGPDLKRAEMIGSLLVFC